MSAKINYKIKQHNYEKIRDQIAAVLAVEFNNQFINYYNTDCEHVEFYIERSTPIDTTETMLVNVGVDSAAFENRHVGQVDNDCKFYIDVYATAKTKGNNPGDKLSAYRAQRITSIIRAILEDPNYLTLGFDPGLIGGCKVDGFNPLVIKSPDGDIVNTNIIRITYSVKCIEGVELPDGIPLLGNDTKIYLNETENGFKIIFETEE